ncbi:Amino acid permease family protein [Candida parapsilosis]|uniref:AA_permease domain-containing protein n=2 Tax=Candida parapsilosis TaxID=5480 RepID=G8BIV3_CANPC|nr:uncharacterized protein CPAR2_403710 [Candida parapsilosis]KAF6047264.1 Amino acid permease family protein [Candida parapsilosis]KAF6047664.1 Amino acid permease family protein [Candida parapsilosis]KAF6050368.1 Amino acid permease family protein [Candida parapsilosis]KAF6061489.1 Amino acid permease family protein [Candida parapsilosis]KAI5904761.1 Proline-specific permease [Candida parapsilosis]
MSHNDNEKSVGINRKQTDYSSSGSDNLIATDSKCVEIDNEGKGFSPSNSESGDSVHTLRPETLERGLKSRHAQLIAIGGAIGTGLFVGSGAVLVACGPASLFISYLLMSSVVYFVMQMLAEMTILLPLPGNGPLAFINDFLSPSFGFALGWNYWYAFSILVGAEVTAAAVVVEYWTKSVNTAIWITVLLAIIIMMNMTSVRFFGESEFWFASIKLIALTCLIITSIVLFFGGGPNHDRLGFRYWKQSAFNEHLTGGSTGRFLGLWTAIIKSGFSYITSPEVVSTTMGETIAPRVNGAKAARRFIWRLIFFYALGSLSISVIVSSRDPHLFGGAEDTSGSPFTIAMQNAGITGLNHVINAVILTSAESAGNSFLYAASRALFSMAQRGNAPKIFAKVNRFGIPVYSVAVSSMFGLLSYLNVSSASATVFAWLSNISTISGFIAWVTIGAAYLRWRKAVEYHGILDRVPYKSHFQPYGAYYAIGMLSIITLTNGYAVFFDFNGADFVAAYITLPFVAVLYFGHRAYDYYKNGHTKWLVEIKDIDLLTNLDSVEDDEQHYEIRVPKNIIQKFWYWLA